MIPVFKPSMDEAEVQAVREVLLSGWIGLGPKTAELERRFAEYVGVRYAVAVNSATTALQLALKVAGIEGREVLTTPMTFVSTNHAILYNDGVPVFCDVEADTMNLDASRLEAMVTDKTRAIVAVHYGGQACDMNVINDLARRKGLFVVEDAAHAAGGAYEGRRVGSLGDIGCFSFHAVKNMACGDGGMLTTNDEAIYKRLMKLRWMGITKDTWIRDSGEGYAWQYNVEELGFKCHMNDISAAIALVQFGKLEAMNERRRARATRYMKNLRDVPGLLLPVQRPYVSVHARHNFVIRTPLRDRLNKALAAEGISSGVHYIPNNLYDMYKKYRGETPVCERAWKELLTLPLYPDLAEQDVDRICEIVRRELSREAVADAA